MCRRRLRAHLRAGPASSWFSWMTDAGSAVPAAKARLRRAAGRSCNLTGPPPARQCGVPVHVVPAGIARSARGARHWRSGGAVLGIVERVRAIMMTPQAEWPVIANESGDALAIRYVAILALIPALARLIGGWLIGGYTPFLSALIGAVVGYALDLRCGLCGGAGGRSFWRQNSAASAAIPSALRLTVYSCTPLWLAGIFLLVPGASFLVLLGLYGLYLMWLGLPVLMQRPSDKTLPYLLVVAVCAILFDIALRFALTAALGVTTLTNLRRQQHLTARRRQIRHRHPARLRLRLCLGFRIDRLRLRRRRLGLDDRVAEPPVELLAAAVAGRHRILRRGSRDCRRGSSCGYGSDSRGPTSGAPCAATRGRCRSSGTAPS